jgi:hypothetical protein
MPTETVAAGSYTGPYNLYHSTSVQQLWFKIKKVLK